MYQKLIRVSFVVLVGGEVKSSAAADLKTAYQQADEIIKKLLRDKAEFDAKRSEERMMFRLTHGRQGHILPEFVIPKVQIRLQKTEIRQGAGGRFTKYLDLAPIPVGTRNK